MGQHEVSVITNAQERTQFVTQLLKDVKALQYLLDHNLFEDDIVRIGAEQEFCLVDSNWDPATNSNKILATINDPHFTTELARYNLEINLDPYPLGDHSFSNTQKQLENLLDLAHKTAAKHGSKVVLNGILPSIAKRHLGFDFMTPSPRYYALNDALKAKRGTDFELYIRGADELHLLHDSVLFEACCTSFQMHLQIPSHDFTKSYNWAQAISGPILSACVNSPMLLGKELWSETRIALFRQSIDIRNASKAVRDKSARVDFGHCWAKGSVVDIFKNDISNHKVMLHDAVFEDSYHMVKNGKIPKLRALQLLNGTIYKWNRPCYGVGGGKPHLRIENRYIPSGPSVIDEIANFALWVGLMKARPKSCDDMANCTPFKTAHTNFIKAARYGHQGVQEWMGKEYTPKELMQKELIPMAEVGLKSAGVAAEEIDHYLKVIDARLEKQTGSLWMTKNFEQLQKKDNKITAQKALVAAMHKNMVHGAPVAEWPQINKKELNLPKAKLVTEIMTTRIFTVHKNDVADLATTIMHWKDVHHVPVVDDQDHLVGLLTWTHIIQDEYAQSLDAGYLVEEVMVKNLVTASPTMTIVEAIKTMKEHEIGCLPVVDNNELVGIITIKDVIKFDTDQKLAS